MIANDNKLIAEFMGCVWKDDIHGDEYYRPNESNPCSIEDLKYHLSWDWLMPVVEKCKSINNKCQQWHAIFSSLQLLKIDIVYKAVVGFIKWYNKETNCKI